MMVIYVQFLPIIAKPKENEVLFDAYDITKTTQNKVAILYEQTGRCPTNLPSNTDNPYVKIRMTTQVEGVAASDCAIIGIIQDVKFPIRYLNNQTFMFYHKVEDDSWHCTSSLSGKQALAYCANE